MTVIGIRYLTGKSVAADITEEKEPEWPPHPARVFMALVAAHFASGADPSEREVLLWLESLTPPKIGASQVQKRNSVDVFVAVNDEAGIGMGRSRQPRTFPSCRPDSDTVYLVYETSVPLEFEKALRTLCGKVTRIGHSSSLVQLWISGEIAIESGWVPSRAGEQRFRVAEQGMLEVLERAFQGDLISEYWELIARLEEAKGSAAKLLKSELKERFGNQAPSPTRPQISSWASYEALQKSEKAAKIEKGLFDENLLILAKEPEGPVLGLETTLELTRALRSALIKSCGESSPAWLSGHEPSGEPTRQPHLAFLPLPFVGHSYGDGHLLGVAIAVPRGLAQEEMQKYLAPFLYDSQAKEKSIRLWSADGREWEWRVRFITESTSKTLTAETWTKPSQVWASVTPVVLHHYPDKGRPEDVERILFEAFVSAGFPRPSELRIRAVSVLKGAGHERDMPKFDTHKSGLSKYQTHIMVRFENLVEGPMFVGRGRYRGYGLMRPVENKEWKLWN